MRTRLAHVSSARDFRRGFATFKSFGDILFLFEGEDAALLLQRDTLANRQAVLAEPGPGPTGFGDFLICFSFYYPLACLENERQIQNHCQPCMHLDRKNLNQEAVGEGSSEGRVNHRLWIP